MHLKFVDFAFEAKTRLLFYPSVNAYIWLLNNGAFLYYMCHLRPDTSWKGNPFVAISCLPRKLLKLISRGACWEVRDDKVSRLQSPVQKTFPSAPNCLTPSVSHISDPMPARGLTSPQSPHFPSIAYSQNQRSISVPSLFLWLSKCFPISKPQFL